MLRCETEQIIVRKGENGYQEYRIPGILPIDGAVLLCYEARRTRGDWGDIDVHVMRLEEGKQPEICRGMDLSAPTITLF